MAIIYGQKDSPTLDLNFAKNKSLIDTMTGRNLVTFSRTQTGNGATYVDADGLIKYAAADEPRFDHDPETGESLGLLVEEARTNLLSYSEDFTQWVSNNTGGTNPIVTPNTIIAPDGTLTADSVFYTSSSAALNGIILYVPPSPLTLTEGVSYTFSVYLKVASGTATIPIGITDDNNLPNDIGINCNLTTSWQRFSVTFTKGTGTLSAGVIGWYANWREQGTGTPIPVGPNVDTTIHVWGAQVEAGSFPTSYIPTEGGTKTRSADVASITGSNFSSWYNNARVGTLFIDRTCNSPGAANDAIVTLGGPSVFDSNIGLFGSGPQEYLSHTSWAVSLWPLTFANAAISGDRKKYAIGFSLETDGTNASVNGVLQGTRTPTNNAITRLSIGGYANTISRLTYWPKRLPDTTLQRLTR